MTLEEKEKRFRFVAKETYFLHIEMVKLSLTKMEEFRNSELPDRDAIFILTGAVSQTYQVLVEFNKSQFPPENLKRLYSAIEEMNEINLKEGNLSELVKALNIHKKT